MSNNFITHAAPPTSPVPKCEQVGEQDRIGSRIRLINKQLAGLFTGYSPAFGDRVNEILQHSPPTDQAMLDAWARIGHGDAIRSPRIDLIHANESSVSPLGVACLISYARGYLDELETIQASTRAAMTPPVSSVETIRTDGPQQTDQPTKQCERSADRRTLRRKPRTNSHSPDQSGQPPTCQGQSDIGSGSA